MASTPPNQEAFLREVDEELRRDELQSLWKRFGRLAVGLLVLVLVAWGGWLYWTDRKTNAAGVEGEQLSQALDDLQAGNADGGLARLKPLAESPSAGYRAAAKMAQAGIAVTKNDLGGAAKLFGEVAADKKMAKPWRDLALVRQSAADFDSVRPDVIVNRLRPLAVSGNPWFGSAGEMMAAAYLKMGKGELAAKLYADIGKDENVPETIRSRAVQMAASLGANDSNTPTKEATR